MPNPNSAALVTTLSRLWCRSAALHNEDDAGDDVYDDGTLRRPRGGGPTVRIVPTRIARGRDVVHDLVANVLPRIHGLCAVFCGNTTALTDARLATWMQRWMDNQFANIWCTGQVLTASVATGVALLVVVAALIIVLAVTSKPLRRK